MANPAAIMIGCSGPSLTVDEQRLIRRFDPLGLILFRRNCADRQSIRSLVQQFRDLVGRADAPVLIDQEGGRVQRLRPPEWPDLPPPGAYGHWYGRNPEAALASAMQHGRIIGLMLADLGVSINAAPVLDILMPGASAVVGDRSFSDRADIVTLLGRAMAEGLKSGGVVPVMKHAPGHGRAMVDSHHELPVVNSAESELEERDFRPFRDLSDIPWAMTAHVVYQNIDPCNPATLSPTVISQVIRKGIGFDGILVSDDLAMGALSGSPAGRVRASLEAGCDIALYCDPAASVLPEVLEAARPTTPEAMVRHRRALSECSVDLSDVRSRSIDWRGEFDRFDPPPDLVNDDLRITPVAET